MEAEINKLKLRRGVLKGQLTRFESFVTDVYNQEKYVELTTRLERIDNIFQDFDSIQTELELLDESERSNTERSDFEDKYFSLISKVKQMLNNSSAVGLQGQVNVQSTNLSSSVTSSVNSQQSSLKLPPIVLPEFDGSYEKWTTFYDTFNSMVNNNNNLSNVEKFYYLQASLKKDAANVIESLEINNSNYQVAWQLIKDRFENKKFVIRSHMKQIFELPVVVKDSHTSLRAFLDNFLKHYRALENLKEPVDSWSTILIYLLASKLDVSSKREWEMQTKDVVSPSIELFKTFLSDRCQLLESVQTKNTKVYSGYTGNKSSCIYCKGDHPIYFCKGFLRLPVRTRFTEIKRLKACTNCLRLDHTTPANCSMSPCRICSKKHNSLLHFNKATQISQTSQVDKTLNNPSTQDNISDTSLPTVTNPGSCPEKVVSSHCNDNAFTILSTAVVYIYSKDGQAIPCRALLDSGSQSNFMVHELQEKLKLDCSKVNVPVVGINSVVSNISSVVKTTIKSCINNYNFKLNFLVIDQITDNIPQNSVDCSHLNIPDNISLADPNFNCSSEIQILLGANIFYNLLLKDQIKLGYNKPIIQNSKLGWVISGPLDHFGEQKTYCYHVKNSYLDKGLESFWSIEEIPHKQNIYSKEEQECEQLFQETFTRDTTGKFIVKLPFRENYLELGDSLKMSERRFQSLEFKLSKNPTLKENYSKFMQEYLSLGHMSPINLDDEPEGTLNFYLPHHCVIKETSLTTKYRVVFDASAKSTSALSLNDVLKTGPAIQSSIISILIRFRTHKIVFTADIAKMYRCIQVQESDKNYQRIVWRFDPSQPLTHYKLNTVTYGTAPASFLATRCLKQLALENASKTPDASECINKNFYMDDWLQSAPNVEAALALIKEVTQILSSAGLHLRQWTSNDKLVMQHLRTIDQLVNTDYVIKDTQSSKTLGVLWNSGNDSFQYTVKTENLKIVSKRIILSVISQIFDSLGLIGPVIIKAKCLLQKLWLSKIGWDDPVPQDIHAAWAQFYGRLECLNHIKIPRQFLLDKPLNIEAHCFSDASSIAYGACLYLRSADQEGNVLVRLVCAKSKVAPLKTVSLPRLELCGALLATKLCRMVLESLDMEIANITFWCDSTIVLAWIATEPYKLKQFVSNRISQIQEGSKNSEWRHVPSECNPADIISRGLNPESICDSTIWFQGPEWLSLDKEKWPTSKFDVSSVDIPEIKENIITLPCQSIKNEIICRYSSLTKLIHVVAYILRFKSNALNKVESRLKDDLSLREIETSRNVIVRLVQEESFPAELRCLKNSQGLPRNSRLLALNPYLADDGTIRVGGRLANSNLDFDNKHPMIIPSNHHFTTLVIRHAHLKNLHAGPQLVLSNIRRQYWPLSGRRVVRSVLRKCVTCFRVRPSNIVQKMGILPRTRVTPNPPFLISGVDYAGPYLIKDGKLRNRQLIKSYICIFVCFSTKAVHLELVSDLSTDGFLSVFKRFIARRGLCSDIYSDNATNFVSANKQLSEISAHVNDMKFKNFLLENKITWHFIPPRSPHFGGLWESAVRLIKFHLKRVVSNVNLTYEEFYTILSQVESIVNSRPLTTLTEDPDSLSTLTPGHFLIGRPLLSLPEVPVSENRHTLASRYRHMKLLVQQFWKGWSRDYLHTLQERSKWRSQNIDIPIGSVVLLMDDNSPPMVWKLGRVTNIFKGDDGVIRVAEVKTNDGHFKRAVQKLCLLPIGASDV